MTLSGTISALLSDLMPAIMRLDSLLDKFTQPEFLPHTSGSSGPPRKCLHRKETLLAAAQGFVTRFPAVRHAVNVLPTDHISGIMPYLRAAAADGKIFDADYRDPASWLSAPFPLHEAAISLVPTQLVRLLQMPEGTNALQRFGLILLGGAAASDELLHRAREAGLRLCPCYGMSETAAMVCALDPDDFLAGHDGVGTPFPHVQLELQNDRLAIRSPAICHGYLPHDPAFQRDPFITNDFARCDEMGGWHILGRADRVIISGGKKIHPEAVEATALTFPGIQAANCFGETDADWGQRVCLEMVLHPEIAATSSVGSEDLLQQLHLHLRARLDSHERPKQIRIIDAASLSSLGKWRRTDK